jgi:hypothetical protein
MPTHGPDGPAVPPITTALLLSPSYCVRASHPKLTPPETVFSPLQVAILMEDGQESLGTSPQVPLMMLDSFIITPPLYCMPHRARSACRWIRVSQGETLRMAGRYLTTSYNSPTTSPYTP